MSKALTKTAALESLRRILAFFPVDKTATKDYLDAVHEQVSEMEPGFFERVCIEMSKTMEPYKRPVPKEYLTVAAKLRAGDDARRNTIGCATCGGNGFVATGKPPGERGGGYTYCTCHPMHRKLQEERRLAGEQRIGKDAAGGE